jgi:NitT/TauT family transport system substrate-binding protein
MVLKKTHVFMLMFIIACFILTSCSGPKTGSGSTEPLKIGILPDVDSLPFIVAKEKGMFKKADVNVELVSFKSPVERDSALQSSQIDGAVSDILAAAFSLDSDMKVKITSITNGRYALLVSGDSGFDNITDLKHVDIGISKNTIIEYMVDTMLTKAGIKSVDIAKIAVPQMPVRLEMLRTGKLKAACLPEPLATAAVNDGAKILADSAQLEVVPGILLFAENAIDDKKEEISRMYEAYEQACDYINENHDPVRDIMVDIAGFPELVRQNFDFIEYTPVKLPEQKDVDSVIEWLLSKHLIKKSITYDDMVCKGFAQK